MIQPCSDRDFLGNTKTNKGHNTSDTWEQDIITAQPKDILKERRPEGNLGALSAKIQFNGC